MKFEDLYLNDGDIDGISVDGNALTLRANHWSGVADQSQIFLPVVCVFSGAREISFKKRDPGPDGRGILFDAERADWSAGSLGFNDRIKAHHPDFEESTMIEYRMAEIDLEAFMKAVRESQNGSRMPMGVADVYHDQGHLQIDTHCDLRMSLRYDAVEISIGTEPSRSAGRTFAAQGGIIHVADATEA